jgi:transcription elongation GreA/GreB family factor
MATVLQPAARESGVYLTASDFDALMAELESLRRAASAHRVSSGAGVGSVVRVRDRAGRVSEYELTEQPNAVAREQVTLGSPLGQALLGARRGDSLTLTAGNGRRRRVRVLEVQPAR